MGLLCKISKSNTSTCCSSTRNLTLDVYKGLLIVLVVIRHILQYSVSDEGGIITNFIWAVQMPGFMMVAGYFASRKLETISAIGKRMLLSVQHYALPFISWFVLINCLLIGKYDRNPLIAITTLFNRIDSGLWFLWVVFVLSIVTTLANYTLSKSKGKILKTISVLCIIYALLIVCAIVININFFGIKYILYYSIFYFCGWLLKWTELWWKQWWPSIYNGAVSIALIVFLVIVFNFDLYHAQDNALGIVMRIFAGLSGNLVLLWCCSKYVDALARIKLGWLGMYTLEIYCVHVNFIQIMSNNKENVLFSLNGFINFSILLALTTIFTLVTICILKCIPTFNFILFGKNKR